MRLVRGRADSPAEDRAVTASMLARAAASDEEAFRAWTPHRQVAFGRRDTHETGYEDARREAERRGYATVERSVGGRAVAYTGTTVAFAHAVPLSDPRAGLDERYEAAVDGVIVALATLGVDARRGEPDAAFCPGDHSVRVDGKVSGIAQRVRSGAALVAGCVLVDDRDELVDVLTAVYGALDLSFDPVSVGTLADSGGPADPAVVCRALERAFVGGEDDPEVTCESVAMLTEADAD